LHGRETARGVVGTDERVAIAWRTWRPRFIANGVPLADVEAVEARVRHWDDWCQGWVERARMHEDLARRAMRERAWLTGGEQDLQAALCYHFGKFFFFHDPDQYGAAHRAMLEAYGRAMTRLPWPGERVEIPFGSARIPGILRRPDHGARPPVVVVLPGLDSVKEELHGLSEDFLRRGLAVLVIDGPGQGELGLHTAMRPDYEVAVRAVVDYLVAARPDLDTTRIGLMGVAFGGYYAVRAMASDPRLTAAAVVGTTDSLARYYDEVPVLTQDALRYRLGVNTAEEAKARLQAFTLDGITGPVERPLLVIAGGQDRVFPPEASERIVRRVGGRARLVVIPEGNHVCNNVPHKYRPLQADWLARTLSDPAWSG
jgi:dienelactone hydrolase